MIPETPLPEIARQSSERKRWVKPLATSVVTLIGAPALVGCFGGGIPSQPDACKPLATSVYHSGPTRILEPPCFDPEAANERHKTIPIDAYSTIFNFTNHTIDVDAVRSTIAFFTAMADSTRPLFLHQNGDNFTVPLDKPIQGDMVQRYLTQNPSPYTRAYFILPTKDNTYVSAFAQNATAQDEYQVSPGDPAYTIESQIGKKQVPTTVSYVYAPGSDDDPGDTILGRFNTEICQSAIEGFARNTSSDTYTSDNASVQESICNTFASALTAVQRGISREDFMNTFVNFDPQSGVFSGDGAPAALIPLQPWVYGAMRQIKPAIAA